MKSVRFYGIHDVRFEEIEKPPCGTDDVLIRVLYAGICGSDMHIYNRKMFIEQIPGTMGHEFVGIIEAVGGNVKQFQAGEHVVGNPMVTCGTCFACQSGHPNACEKLGFIGEVRDGCFAEYLVMPEETLVKVPDDADFCSMALAEPLAVVLNLCEKANFQPDDRLCILGAGPIGLLTLLAAKQLYGVEQVTVVGRSEARLKLAKKLGAGEVCTFVEGKYFTKIVEAAGVEATLQQAVSCIAPGGNIYAVSIFEDDVVFDVNTLIAKEAVLQGCNAYEQRHIADAVRVLSGRQIDVSGVISAVLPPEDCGEAFEKLNSRNKDVCKVLFKMEREEQA